MITVAQIKAARGLLEWNQAQLAHATGLHLNAISNVERRRGSPRAESMALIQQAFEREEIRFIGLSGVELVPEQLDIRKFSGAGFIRALTDDLLTSLTGPRDELLSVLSDEKLFDLEPEQNSRYYRAKAKSKFRQRVILNAQTSTIYGDRNEYRMLPAAVLGAISYNIYGDKLALINWSRHEVVVIRNQSVAEMFRKQFNYFWEQGKVKQ